MTGSCWPKPDVHDRLPAVRGSRDADPGRHRRHRCGRRCVGADRHHRHHRLPGEVAPQQRHDEEDEDPDGLPRGPGGQ